MTIMRHLMVTVLAILLCACGGGSNEGAPPVPVLQATLIATGTIRPGPDQLEYRLVSTQADFDAILSDLLEPDAFPSNSRILDFSKDNLIFLRYSASNSGDNLRIEGIDASIEGNVIVRIENCKTVGGFMGPSDFSLYKLPAVKGSVRFDVTTRQPPYCLTIP